MRELKIGDKVYHRDVYEHKELLTIMDIKDGMLLLQGDYSGGTNRVTQESWLPIKGTSRIYNHEYKKRVRQEACDITTLAIPCAGSKDNTYLAMMDMVNAVFVLTNDVSLNDEY